MSADPSSADASMPTEVDLVMPFFCRFNMTILSLVVLIPLSLWTMKSVCSLYKNVPNAGLKIPAILIFIGPFVLQFTNLVCLQIESESALAMITLAAKVYIVVLFYSFYFLVREVVFFEHLLQSAEA